MGVEKEIITEGNGVDYPKKGDKVAMQYTGWLHDPSQDETKGNQYWPPNPCGLANCIRFDSSEGRGDFKVKIGTGQVIKGNHPAVASQT